MREFGGVGLQATEMICARGFLWMEKEEEGHPDRLWGVADEPRPLAVQIWDNDPETLAAVGAKLAHEFKVSVVDINFGCPVKQVTQKAHSGSYLLRCPATVGRIVERVVKACEPTPVTAKIRLGCTRNTINAIEVAQTVESAGAAAITVHGRTAQDFFTGSADWDRISEIKDHLRRMPLIGNGDLTSPKRSWKPSTVQRRWRDDRPRGAWQAVALSPGGGGAARRADSARSDARRRAAVTVAPLPAGLRAVRRRTRHTLLMRKFACCYAQGRPGAREFRGHVAKCRSRRSSLTSSNGTFRVAIGVLMELFCRTQSPGIGFDGL